MASHAGGLGDKIYGVWDTNEQAWHTNKLTDDEAEKLAADLNAQHSRTGPRRATDWYQLDPPVPIDINFGTWQPAEIDYWVRESDGWYAHVLQPGSEPRWYHSGRLRPRAGNQDVAGRPARQSDRPDNAS